MTLRRVAVAVVIVLIALPAVLTGALWLALRTSTARHYAEAAVERATGHELHIGGRVRIVPSLIPTLAVDDVALLNPPGFSGPYLAHARQVRARVALLPIVHGVVEVRTLRVLGPEVKLEVNEAGQGNWQRPPAPASATPAAPGGGPRLTVSLRRVEVADGALAWSSFGRSFRVNVSALTAELGSSGAPITFTATVNGPEATASVQGRLADPDVRRGLDATVIAQIGDLAALVPGAPALRDLALRASVTDPDGLDRGITVGNLSATAPQGDLGGTATVSWQLRPALRGALRSKRLDADGLLALAKHNAPPPVTASAPPPATPPPAPAARRLIPNTPLPVAGLRAADAELSYGADALRLGGTEFHQVQAGIHLTNGTLRLDPVTAASPGGPLQGRATLDGAAVPPRLALNLVAPSLDLAAFVPGAAGAVSVNADLTGQGTTWREVAAGLGGEADVTAVDGQIDLGKLGALGTALHRAGVPVTLSGQAHLRCLAVRALASGGSAALSPVVLDAGRLGLRGDGQVNLGDEALDLHLRAALQVGPAAAEVPIHVSGTLAEPEVTAERVSGRLSLSITGAEAPDACVPALAAARGGRPGPEPASSPAQPRAERPADLLRELLR